MPDPAPGGETIGLWTGLKEIHARMSRRRRRQLYFVLLLMLSGAIAELATISAVIPFLALLARTGSGGQHAWAFLARITPAGADTLIVAATIFIFVAVVAGIIRIQLAWSSRKFVLQLGHELAVEIQRRVLLQPFSFHIHRNSSTLLAALNKTELAVMDVLLPLMHAVTGAVIAAFVVAILLWINPVTTVLALAGFIAIYALITAATRRRLAANSLDVDTAYDERLKTAQESLGGIRDVILDNSQPLYLRQFAKVDAKLADVRATNQFIVGAPRYLLETLGMIVIAAIALAAARRVGGIGAALPVLGALALGAQRLLPLVQQVYGGWSSVAAQRSVFGQVIGLLRLPVDESAQLSTGSLQLRRAITVEHVSFTYPTRSRKTLEDVSLSIPSGSMLALVGATGSGKSTLLDLLMGLLQPDDGRILIDEVPLTPARRRQWHRSVAHVPQSIFLADLTIAQNIALSLPNDDPDHDRIIDSAKKAQLHDFVVSLPAGYKTFVGERGIRLSGGQRQRLGIARAIYKNAPILILDEATSALDELTENAVIAALDRLRHEGRTIIIVAHRLSTIRRCDLVARLEDGRIVEFGRFSEVLGARERLP